jgi:hypothetical protein
MILVLTNSQILETIAAVKLNRGDYASSPRGEASFALFQNLLLVTIKSPGKKKEFKI